MKRMRTTNINSGELPSHIDELLVAKVSNQERFALYLFNGFISIGGYRQFIELFIKYFGTEENLLSTNLIFRANLFRLRALATIKLYQRNLDLGIEEEK